MTVIYDGNKMQQCLDALAAASCDQTAEDRRVTPPVCSATLRGTVAGGGVCHLDVECVSHACSAQCDAQNACCEGTCIGDTLLVSQPIAIGQPCVLGSGSSCVEGAYCDTNSERCAALVPAGSSCDDDAQCDYGLGCFGSLGNTCQLLPTLGQPCIAFRCRDEGTLCSATTMVCVAEGLASATCMTSSDCSQFYQCDATAHQCQPNPGLGQSCSTTQSCFDVDTYCDPSTLICSSVRGDGQPCTSNEGCTSGQCTISDTVGMCVAPTTCI